MKAHLIGRLAILSCIAGTYFATAVGDRRTQSDPESSTVQDFGRQFTKRTIVSGQSQQRSTRTVNPSLAHISGWISAVGAAVAVLDYDGDGLDNDLCLVDPRRDHPELMPLPGTGERFAARLLDPGPDLFNSSSMAAMGCLPGDFNADGHVDFAVYYWGRSPILFSGDGVGFRAGEIYPEAPGEGRWFTNAATTADFDGDGRLDLLFANYFPDGAEIIDPASPNPQSMQHSMSRAYNAGGTYLLRGLGPGPGPARFRAVDLELPREILHGWTLALGAADLDGDLLPEIYLANDFGPDRLLVNRSTADKVEFSLAEARRGLSDIRSGVLGRDSFKGMGIDFGDLDGDGRLDLFVGNITSDYALHESSFAFLGRGDVALLKQGIAPYENAAQELGLTQAGWCWDSRLADFNNDGRPEAVQATGFLKGEVNRWPELQELATANDELLAHPEFWPRFTEGDELSGHEAHHFFAWDGRQYVDIAEAVGLGDPVVGRGVAVADIDGDADLDLIFANQWADSTVHENRCERDCGRGLSVRLYLAKQSSHQTAVAPATPGHRAPQAVGAQVRLRSLAPGSTLAEQIAVVDGGNGHSGVRSQELHFGVGHDPGPFVLDIRWRNPDGRKQQAEHQVEAGRHSLILPWNSLLATRDRHE